MQSNAHRLAGSICSVSAHGCAVSSAVAEAGGHTHFRMSNVHIKPVLGSALFFSYVDPESLEMDDGFTQHSGCPVFKGEKKIITQWIRKGVDEQNQFFLFDEGKNRGLGSWLGRRS